MANSQPVSHPLEQLSSWFGEKDNLTIAVTELYDDGPDRLGLSETEFRQWVAEGVVTRILRFTDLTGALRRDPEVALPEPLPLTPPVHYGGY
jgi:hypothetical protein